MEKIILKLFVYYNCDSLDEVFQCLVEFCDNGFFCDVLLCVENREIFVYWVILVVFSLYFKVMFFGNFLESKQYCVVFYEIDVLVIEMLVEFIYIGVLKIEKSNVYLFLYVLVVFQFEKVRKVCCEFFFSVLNIYNCLGI